MLASSVDTFRRATVATPGCAATRHVKADELRTGELRVLTHVSVRITRSEWGMMNGVYSSPSTPVNRSRPPRVDRGAGAASWPCSRAQNGSTAGRNHARLQTRFARTAKIGMRRLKLPLSLLNFRASFGRTWEVSLISPAMARILACQKLCISKGGSGTANLVARRVHAASRTN